MRPSFVALAIFLLCRIAPAVAQTPEPFYYYMPAFTGNLATTVTFADDSYLKKVTVCIVNPRQKKVRVSLYKDGQRNWYPASLRSCSLPFNFSGADPGEYMITVYVDDKKYIKKVTVKK